MQNSESAPKIEPRTAPRRRRSAAAVIAQYIQDLTHPAEPAPCPTPA